MTTYTVDFFKLVNYGGELVPDGTTNILGYEEVFYTEDEKVALEEYESRKRMITAENMLGTNFIRWEGDVPVFEKAYSSDDIINDNMIDRIVENVNWNA